MEPPFPTHATSTSVLNARNYRPHLLLPTTWNLSFTMTQSIFRLENVCTDSPKLAASVNFASSRISPNTATTPCLFQHETRDITFCLVVDDFVVRYGSQSDADHLIATLRANQYDLTIKPNGDTYLGMNISFAPDSISISMPGYINKALTRFRPQYLLSTHRAATTPGKYNSSIYPRIQYVKEDKSPLLTPTQRTEIQAIVETLLYYARAVDPSLLPIANEIASQQANPTQKVLIAANRALSYASARQKNKTIASPTTPVTCISFFTWMLPTSLGLMHDQLLGATSF